MQDQWPQKGAKDTRNLLSPILPSVFSVYSVTSPLIIAHRGASAEKPENTLAAFRRALALNADGIELDVQVTRDGVPVVFHDATLRRLTGQPGRLAGKTWAELRKLRVQETEPIPRLASVLALVRGRVAVQIELKRGASVAAIVRVLRGTQTTKGVILSSFETGLLRQAVKLAPQFSRLLISEGHGGAGKLLRQMAAVKAAGLSLHCRAVRSRAFVERIHQQGATLWCWTVNDRRVARRLAGWGVDALVGDNPALLKRAL
jgi:glycerophosphoryl diester phosphodiesterase